MTKTCRHATDVDFAPRCGLCNSHGAGSMTAQLRGEPDDAQRQALDQLPAANRAAWWCGFREGLEPDQTDPRTGHRVSTHVHDDVEPAQP